VDTDTRTRIVHAAMELFGTQGYAATTIAQIEAAAGLSPGSGGLYKHFRSKEALLEAGVRERIETPDALDELFAAAAGAPNGRAALRLIADAGMRRLESERDLNRILVRDLARFPRLLALFREGEMARVHRGLAAAMQAMGIPAAEAVSLVLIAAVSDYWLLADIFGGTHPLGVGREAFLDTLADLAAATIPTRDNTKEK
jgi:AcrR family transcriptional regulator